VGSPVLTDSVKNEVSHEGCSDPRHVLELRAEQAKRALVREAERTGKKPTKFKGLPAPRTQERRRKARTPEQEERILHAKLKASGTGRGSFSDGSAGGIRRPADTNLHKLIGPVQNYQDDT
jgi:hypothetical protein